MAKWYKQSTAASLIAGPFVAETDGYTSKESFTSLSGILFKSDNASQTVNPTVVHTASGYYVVELDSGSTNTVGRTRLAFANSSSHIPVWEDFMVLTASAYDSIVAGTDLLGAELAASGITASKFGAGAVDAAAIAASAITASKMSACAFDISHVSATWADKVADHVIRRSWINAAESGDGDAKSGRSLLGAAAKLVNKIEVTGGCLVVYEEDDSTVLFRQPVTACDAASPIVALDTT